MKINEFKKPKQIDEGMADNLFGAYNVPEKLRSMFSGQDAVANPAKAQKIFINDFYSKIKLALDNAVKGGLVNPSITQFIQPQPNHPAPKPAPSPAPAPNTKPQTTPNASPATPANYYGNVSPSNVKAATPTSNPLSAPVVNRGNTITANTTPGQPAPTRGGITSGGIGYKKPTNTSSVRSATPTASPATPAPVPPKAPKPAGPTSAQQTVDAAKQHRQEIAKAQQVQAAGKAAAAKPGFQRTAADRIAMKAAGLSEDAYDRLNTIFESIMEAGEEPQQQGIYQFVRNWYADYMGNLNWKAHEPQINKLLQNVQTSYKTDGGKAALSQLAQATYSLASATTAGRNGSRPSYADNEYASPQQSIQNLPPEQIKKAMVSLHNRNPYEYNQIKKTLPE